MNMNKFCKRALNAIEAWEDDTQDGACGISNMDLCRLAEYLYVEFQYNLTDDKYEPYREPWEQEETRDEPGAYKRSEPHDFTNPPPVPRWQGEDNATSLKRAAEVESPAKAAEPYNYFQGMFNVLSGDGEWCPVCGGPAHSFDCR